MLSELKKRYLNGGDAMLCTVEFYNSHFKFLWNLTCAKIYFNLSYRNIYIYKIIHK